MAGKLLEQIDGRIKEGINICMPPEQREEEYEKLMIKIRKAQGIEQLTSPVAEASEVKDV
jgi:hypothetical protein